MEALGSDAATSFGVFGGLCLFSLLVVVGYLNFVLVASSLPPLLWAFACSLVLRKYKVAIVRFMRRISARELGRGAMDALRSMRRLLVSYQAASLFELEADAFLLRSKVDAVGCERPQWSPLGTCLTQAKVHREGTALTLHAAGTGRLLANGVVPRHDTWDAPCAERAESDAATVCVSLWSPNDPHARTYALRFDDERSASYALRRMEVSMQPSQVHLRVMAVLALACYLPHAWWYSVLWAAGAAAVAAFLWWLRGAVVRHRFRSELRALQSRQTVQLMEALRARPDVADGLSEVTARVLRQAEGMSHTTAADGHGSGSDVSSDGSGDEMDGSEGPEAGQGSSSSSSSVSGADTSDGSDVSGSESEGEGRGSAGRRARPARGRPTVAAPSPASLLRLSDRLAIAAARRAKNMAQSAAAARREGRPAPLGEPPSTRTRRQAARHRLETQAFGDAGTSGAVPAPPRRGGQRSAWSQFLRRHVPRRVVSRARGAAATALHLAQTRLVAVTSAALDSAWTGVGRARAAVYGFVVRVLTQRWDGEGEAELKQDRPAPDSAEEDATAPPSAGGPSLGLRVGSAVLLSAGAAVRAVVLLARALYRGVLRPVAVALCTVASTVWSQGIVAYLDAYVATGLVCALLVGGGLGLGFSAMQIGKEMREFYNSTVAHSVLGTRVSAYFDNVSDADIAVLLDQASHYTHHIGEYAPAVLELSEVARESLDVYAELRRNLTQREQEFQRNLTAEVADEQPWHCVIPGAAYISACDGPSHAEGQAPSGASGGSTQQPGVTGGGGGDDAGAAVPARSALWQLVAPTGSRRAALASKVSSLWQGDLTLSDVGQEVRETVGAAVAFWGRDSRLARIVGIYTAYARAMARHGAAFASAFLGLITRGAQAAAGYAMSWLVFVLALFTLVTLEEDAFRAVERVAPSSRARRAVRLLERSLRLVFVGTVKVFVYHMVIVWLFAVLFQARFGFLTALLSGTVAVVPFFPAWLVPAPSALELTLRNSPWAGMAFWLLSYGYPVWFVDPDIYAEMKSGNAALTGLAIVLGVASFGLTGAVLGPLVLSVLAWAFAVWQQEQSARNPARRGRRRPRALSVGLA